MSMNGLTVIRTIRSPSIRRSLARRPGSADTASVIRVEIPKSQLSQIIFHTSPIVGCDSEDCSESKPSRDSLTAILSCCGTS
ncbi:hypothetical protein MYCSP_18925 [Mycobacteroides saopaulense]|nr:hypothetical protein MYCSP_18925 [Mycobacteroides saopaulense]